MHPLRLLKDDSGATLIFLVVVLVALISVAALAVDLGQMYVAKQRAQNVCDAAALAGVRCLDPSLGKFNKTSPIALAEAGDYAVCNNGSTQYWKVYKPSASTNEGVDVTFPDNSAIRTEGQIHVNFAFAGIFGKKSTNVKAHAVARLVAAQTVTQPFIPLVVAQTTVEALQDPLAPGATPTQIQLKARDWKDALVGLGAGNYGAVDLPGDTGGGDFGGRLAGTNTDPFTLSIGDTIKTEPGNMVGPTNAGIDARIASDPVYQPVGDVSAWDQWFAEYEKSTPGPTFSTTPRLVVVPIIEDPDGKINGKGTVTVKGFAAFFIDTNADDGTVNGYFVGATFSQSAINMGTIWWLGPSNSSSTVMRGHLVE